MLVYRRVTPSSMSLVPIYAPGWRETMWGKVSCLRKQHDGRDCTLNPHPSNLKSSALLPHHYAPTIVLVWPSHISATFLTQPYAQAVIFLSENLMCPATLLIGTHFYLPLVVRLNCKQLLGPLYRDLCISKAKTWIQWNPALRTPVYNG